MANRLTRRQFLGQAARTGSAAAVASTLTAPATGAPRSPNDKLNIAIIGPGGRGGANLQGVSTENIVALCDVDERRGAAAFGKFPRAKRYRDFRRMLSELDKHIDAVVVSTPDHTHAAASVIAMKMGKHCYCEKPLTWCVHEARVVRQTAAQHKVATQMGNQGTASAGLRSGVKVLQAGIIGKVREIHVWSDRPWNGWAQGKKRPKDTPPVPAGLDWDLWLGPAPKRPYHPEYVPTHWRMWQEFGTGALGDMGCHTMNLPAWALKLEDPTSIEAESFPMNDETYPKWSIVHWEFPARGELPTVKLTWYDGWAHGGKRPPQEWLDGKQLTKSGALLIGEKGKFYQTNDTGTSWMLLPEDRFRDNTDVAAITGATQGVDHHQEWIAACKGGPPAKSNFDYAARLAETVVLGNVALRMGKRIEWDAERMQAKNCPEAEPLITRPYRDGWTL
jgi:predicted dehydrogenase